ncbi:MAG: ABC transporter substrate-binding protein [bacterium]|nr:ABC transporter substrate-binding protein [bacterium]
MNAGCRARATAHVACCAGTHHSSSAWSHAIGGIIIHHFAWLLLLLPLPLAAAAAVPVRLQLKWPHQFQFAGYYAAQAQGYYQAAGLAVEIIPCAPGTDAVHTVVAGQAEFGVGTTDLLLRRAQGAPVVVLAVIFQHSPLALMTLKHSGVHGGCHVRLCHGRAV